MCSFPAEYELYSPQEYTAHLAGNHPSCSYCKTNFYDKSELYAHVKSEHYVCTICAEINPKSHRYFRDPQMLAQHLKTDHYTCDEKECRGDLRPGASTFASLFALQAHKREMHKAASPHDESAPIGFDDFPSLGSFTKPPKPPTAETPALPSPSQQA